MCLVFLISWRRKEPTLLYQKLTIIFPIIVLYICFDRCMLGQEIRCATLNFSDYIQYVSYFLSRLWCDNRVVPDLGSTSSLIELYLEKPWNYSIDITYMYFNYSISICVGYNNIILCITRSTYNKNVIKWKHRKMQIVGWFDPRQPQLGDNTDPTIRYLDLEQNENKKIA